MHKIYTCKICGASSENKRKILDCEEQGANNLYTEGQKLTFFKDKQRVTGTVAKIQFSTNNRHHPFYELSIEGKLNVTVAERNILHAEPLTTTTT